MKYVFINKLDGNAVGAIVNAIDPQFPDIPIENRFSPEFLEGCVKISAEEFEELGIHSGMIYDFETGKFSEPSVEDTLNQEVVE